MFSPARVDQAHALLHFSHVNVFRGGILREECTVLLPDRGRRTIFLAVKPGSARVGATVEPASDLAMPAWLGEVIVRGAHD